MSVIEPTVIFLVVILLWMIFSWGPEILPLIGMNLPSFLASIAIIGIILVGALHARSVKVGKKKRQHERRVAYERTQKPPTVLLKDEEPTASERLNMDEWNGNSAPIFDLKTKKKRS